MAKTGSKILAFFFNILIILLSAAAIVSYFYYPLWKIDASYTVKEEALRKMIGDETAEKVDLEEIVGDGITVKLSLDIQTMDVWNNYFSSENEEKPVSESIIERNVNGIVDSIAPILNDIAEKAVRATAKKTLKQTVRDKAKEYLAAEDEAKLDDVLEKAGFTDSYIDEQTDKLVDALTAEDANVDGVSGEVVAAVEDVIEKLRTSGEPEFASASLSEEDKADIKAAVEDALSFVADESGNIDTSDFAAKLILEALREQNKKDETETETAAAKNSYIKPLALASKTAKAESESGEPSETEAEDYKEELKSEVKTYLLNLLPESFDKTTSRVLTIVFYVLAFTFFTWAWLVLKIILKLVCRNPAIKLKFPIWLGWLPFLALVLLPWGAVKLVSSGASFIGSMLGAEALAAVQNFLSVATLSFHSASIVSAVAAIALIIIWIPYGIIRRSLRDR